MQIVVVIVALALAWVIQAGWIYQTGYDWFTSCWTAVNSHREASSPQEASAWAQCEPVAKRALFNAGFVFAGDPRYEVTPALQAIVQSCPSSYSDLPIGGVYLLAVPLIQQNGGPGLVDRFIPPDAMIVRAFKSKWPNCPAARETNGIPKIILKDGDWVFESPCKPCEDERKAANGER